MEVVDMTAKKSYFVARDKIYDREREINESISKPFVMIDTSMISKDGRMKLGQWM